MKKHTNLDSVTALLTNTKWEEKINVWKEKTSTSPSEFHLTHSKALVAHHDCNIETREGRVLENKPLQLIDWQVQLINLAIANCYSYERWKTKVNVIILKEPGDFWIHRLRVIHLYEHDYIMNLAIKWRKLIKQCDDSKLLNDGQYGGVPGRSLVMPTILEELQYEICQASRRPLIHTDYDATACYDRVIMNIGGLIARCFGQHRSVVFINGNTLKEAKYLLKTQLKVPKKFYQHSLVFPIYGCGQGAGNLPGLWCCISSILFDCYEHKSHGASFQSPDGSIQCNIYMIGFVDDTSRSTNNFDQPMQLPLQHYIDLALA